MKAFLILLTASVTLGLSAQQQPVLAGSTSTSCAAVLDLDYSQVLPEITWGQTSISSPNLLNENVLGEPSVSETSGDAMLARLTQFAADKIDAPEQPCTSNLTRALRDLGPDGLIRQKVGFLVAIR